MQCDGDCLNCKIPYKKCKGGGRNSATPWRGANRILSTGKGRTCKQASFVSKKKPDGGWQDEYV